MLDNAKTNSRDAMMDCLKGVAIVFIVITHFKWTSEQRLAYCFPFWIDMAMPIFMLVAGYMGAMSFTRHQISTLAEGYQFKGLVRRFKRFLMPFILLAPCDVICGVAKVNPSSWKGALFALIFGGQGPGSYFVPMMLQFVLLFPLIFWVIRRFRLFGLVFLFAVNVCYEFICGSVGISTWAYRLIFLRHLGVVSIGAYSFDAIFSARKTSVAIGSFLSAFIGGAYIYAVNYGGYEPFVFTRWVNTSLPAALFAVGIVGFSKEFLKVGNKMVIFSWGGGGVLMKYFWFKNFFMLAQFLIYMHCQFLLNLNSCCVARLA